jgi:hypothetical protein
MALGEARTGELAVCQGDAEGGIKSLEAALAKIEVVGYELMTTEFRIALVQGLAALGRTAEAAERVDGAIRTVQTKGDLVFMPELLRVKAGLQATDQDARRCLKQSLDWSRRQGARALELRAATDLAARLMAQGRSDHARALLQPVFEQFTEGHEAVDLKAAERLLATLRNEPPFA